MFVPESNLAYEGIRLSDDIKRSGLKNVCVMKEDDNRAGVRTNNDLKKGMAISFQKILNKGMVRFHQHFVCLTENSGVKMTTEEMKDEIINQLIDFKRIIKPSKDPYKPATELFSGKRGCGYDDLTIATILNPVMQRRFFGDDVKYGSWYTRTVK